jgi:hypothetical protein
MVLSRYASYVDIAWGKGYVNLWGRILKGILHGIRNGGYRVEQLGKGVSAHPHISQQAMEHGGKPTTQTREVFPMHNARTRLELALVTPREATTPNTTTKAIPPPYQLTGESGSATMRTIRTFVQFIRES